MNAARSTPIRRPGWPEVLAAAVVYVAAYATLPRAAIALTEGQAVATGLALAAVSGVLGLLAFLAAFLIRIRRWDAFGIGRVSARWVLIGIGMGLVALVATRLIAFGVLLVTGSTSGDPQGDYRAAAAGGIVPLVLQLVFIAVLTPIGEEFAFRAVLTNALRRYGAVVSVVGSAVVFALAHGINLALIPAIVVGVINAVLFLRSGSVWPGVIVHAVNNGLGTFLGLLAGGSAT
jgi:uncharacterized protein